MLIYAINIKVSMYIVLFVNYYRIRNPLAYSIANVLLLVCGIFVIIVVWFDVIYRKVRLRTTKRSKIRTIRRIHKYLEYALKTAIGRMVVVSSMLLLCLLAAWIPLVSCNPLTHSSHKSFIHNYVSKHYANCIYRCSVTMWYWRMTMNFYPTSSKWAIAPNASIHG